MFWNAVVVLVSLSSLAFLLWRLLPLKDYPTTFLFLAIWGRYLVAGLHDFTMVPRFAGFTGVALYSITVIVIGLLFVNPRQYLQFRLVPFYALFLLAFISSIINQSYSGLISEFPRWMFFIIITLLSYRAFMRYGFDHTIRLFFLAVLAPFILQLLSIGIGYSVITHDGSIAYIGGYYTDSSFSKILFTLICLCALLRTRQWWWSIALTLAASFGIYMTNYRTGFLGVLPIVGLMLASVFVKLSAPSLRPVVIAAGILVLMTAAPLAFQFVPERYQAVLELAGNLEAMFEPPEQLTLDDASLATGRVWIWALHIDAWRTGSAANMLLGFGPESYDISPHSEFIAFLYQFGVVGLALLLVILGWQFALMSRLPDRMLSLRLMGCLVGFVLSCSAELPLWAIEGLITFALLCSATWAIRDGALNVEPRAAAPAPAPQRRIGARWTKGRPGGTAIADAARPTVASKLRRPG